MAFTFPALEVSDPDAQLNFDQISHSFPLRILYGVVGSDGTTTQTGSADWSASRSSAGTYTLTLNAALPTTPFCVVTPSTTAGTFAAKVTSVSTTQIGILTYATTTGTATDTEFHFIIAGT